MSKLQNLLEELLTEEVFDFSSHIDSDPEKLGENFVPSIIRFYECEYKLTAINNSTFKGMPQRKDNIKKKLEGHLLAAEQNIIQVLKPVFKNWLEQHELDADKWAKSRLANQIKEMDDNTPELHFVTQMEYQSGFAHSFDIEDYNYFDMMYHDIEQFPVLKKFIEEYLLDNFKDSVNSDLDEDQEPYKMETAEDFIAYLFDTGELESGFKYYVLENAYASDKEKLNIVEEFVAKCVYPVWHMRWVDGGDLEHTRELIQKYYDLMNSATDVQQMVAVVSFALNAVHQTGDMLDYVQDYLERQYKVDHDAGLKQLLNRLTHGHHDHEKWRQDLAEAGFGIGFEHKYGWDEKLLVNAVRNTDTTTVMNAISHNPDRINDKLEGDWTLLQIILARIGTFKDIADDWRPVIEKLLKMKASTNFKMRNGPSAISVKDYIKEFYPDFTFDK